MPFKGHYFSHISLHLLIKYTLKHVQPSKSADPCAFLALRPVPPPCCCMRLQDPSAAEPRSPPWPGSAWEALMSSGTWLTLSAEQVGGLGL